MRPLLSLALSPFPFECTECGDCCRVAGDVWFDREEARRVEGAWSDALVYESSHRRVRRSEEQCHFLEGDKCSIHSRRPQQCRAYPFWPRILAGRRWEDEPCEGIGRGDVVELSEDAERWAAWLRRFPAEAAAAIDDTERWARLVVDLGLCPWAKAAVDDGKCFYFYAEEATSSSLRAAVAELDEVDIVFAIFPKTKKKKTGALEGRDDDDDFPAFHDALDDVEDDLLHNYDAQIAGFHPSWTFAALPPDDPLHFEKRSPHPTISIIRAADVANAHQATARIATENERILAEKGYRALRDTFKATCGWSMPHSSQ